jgi:hypothetical protein
MRLSTFVQAAVLSLALPFAANGVKHEQRNTRRHHEFALQARGEGGLEARGEVFQPARLTFYDVGLYVLPIVTRRPCL